MNKLIGRLHSFFIPERYKKNEQEFRKARMLVNTLLLSSLFGTFYFCNTILFEMHYIMFNMVFCVLSFTITLFLFKAGVSKIAAANIFSATAYTSTLYNVYFSQGLYSWCLPWLCMAPVLALLLIDKRYGYLWLALSVIGSVAIGAMHMGGYHFPNDINPNDYSLMTLNAITGLILIMFFISVVMNDASGRAMDALETKNQDILWQKALAESERRKATQSEKFKQQFLTNMSHEIRTPMNAILGLTNVLIEKNPNSEQLLELEIIKSSSETLYTIINDILDLSKIEAGRLELEAIPFEPKKVIETVAKTFGHKAMEKGLALNVSYDNTIPRLLVGDPTRLNQILTNLVSNAVKFTSDGSVDIKVEKSGSNIMFSVKDSGIGMTREQLGIIFEPFRQADAGTTRKYGGTGLGLSISKELIDLHDSALLVESEPGKGSKFSFVVNYPTAEAHAIQQKDTEITPTMLEELKGLRILLAEDNEFNCVVAIETLSLKIPGVVVNIAVNGKEAIDRLPGNDIVLMDMHMPVMDGYEATHRIRRDAKPPLNNIPIIALTASVLEDNFDRCFEIGMNDVLPKPFRTDMLLLSIYNAMKGRPSISAARRPARHRTEQHGKVSDINVLKIFCEEDNARVKKYIGIYLNSAPATLAKMDKQLKQGDFNNLKLTIHTFKTHLKYMGMDHVSNIAKKIEMACENGKDAEKIDRLLKAVSESCTVSFAELKEYL